MVQAPLGNLRHPIHTLHVLASTHATSVLTDDDFSIIDLEDLVLTGGIIGRPRDAMTRESLCVIVGTISKALPPRPSSKSIRRTAGRLPSNCKLRLASFAHHAQPQYCPDRRFSPIIRFHRNFDGRNQWREHARRYQLRSTLRI